MKAPIRPDVAATGLSIVYEPEGSEPILEYVSLTTRQASRDW